MGTATEFNLHVHYGFIYATSGDVTRDQDIASSRGGQRNGLCGAAYPGALVLVTGLHTGQVPFTITVHDTEPALEDEWEDVVEASWHVTAPACAVSTFDTTDRFRLPRPGWYRARYCATGMDAAHQQDTRLEGEPVVDRYALDLWPAAEAPDAIVRQGSQTGAYWHAVAVSTAPPPPPPTPQETAAAKARQEAQEAASREQMARDRERASWDGVLPSDALRTAGYRAAELARVDRDLAERIAALPSEELRQVGAVVAHFASARARSDQLDWAAAVDALSRGEALPVPFDDPQAAWAVLFPPLTGTMTTTAVAVGITMSDAWPPKRELLHPDSAALSAVVDAARPEQPAGTFSAIAQAAMALEEPEELYGHLRHFLAGREMCG